MYKKLMTAVALLVFGLLVQNVAQAQTSEAAGHKMTLNDCMRYAISNSTKVRIQQAATDNAQINRRDAILRTFTPSVSAYTSGGYGFGRSIDPETNTYFNRTSFSNSYSASASMPVFDGFSAVNNMKIAKTSLAMGYTREKQVEADVCLAVMQVYYNVLYYNEIVEIYEAQVKTAETSVAQAEKQESLGLKGHADVVQMKASLADREYALVNARNQYNNHLMTLKDLMFWPVDEPLEIDDSVADKDEIALTASDEKDAVADYAAMNNPKILIAKGTLFNAQKSLNSAKWQLLPSLSLSGGVNTGFYKSSGAEVASFGNQFRNNLGQSLSLSLSIPIFNRLSAHSNIARYRNQVRTAEAEYDQAKRDVESEVTRAVQDRDGAGAAFMQAQRKAEVQEEAYYLNSKKMEQGLVSVIEYQTATNNYLQAKADRLNSLFQYLIKHSVVRYYAGEEYINQ